MNNLIKDIALSETKSVFKKALRNFAKKNEVGCSENQLLIRANAEGVPFYTYCIDYEEKNRISFKEVLGVKIDFKNREAVAEPFISKTISRLKDKHSCNSDDVKIYACTFDEKAKDVYLFGYIKNQKIGQISFDWLFS
jgi:hypothetical protein|tara:strand:- start:2231 stop:2644 length:414 start_codon:yes stop_codon:yes gene_type:complete